jgi:hypothetical protein
MRKQTSFFIKDCEIYIFFLNIFLINIWSGFDDWDSRIVIYQSQPQKLWIVILVTLFQMAECIFFIMIFFYLIE